MSRYSIYDDPQMRRVGFYPPPASRFCEYGPEDRRWMEPLGIGDTVYFTARFSTGDFPPLLSPVPYLMHTITL